MELYTFWIRALLMMCECELTLNSVDPGLVLNDKEGVVEITSAVLFDRLWEQKDVTNSYWNRIQKTDS